MDHNNQVELLNDIGALTAVTSREVPPNLEATKLDNGVSVAATEGVATISLANKQLDVSQ